MARLRLRRIAVGTTLALALAACGNSTDGGGSATPAGDGPTTTANGDRNTFVEISGVPGVSDEEIAYTAIGTKANNPLGNCILDCYVEGIEAYFAFRNSEGGIYGRDLVLDQVLDDELGQNQVRSLEVASGNDAFGAFQATLLASGWGDLESAGVPTYAWGIHATEAANRPHIFPSIAVRCGDCTGRSVPFAAKEAGASKVASIGYGISENSKVCTNAVAASVELYADDIGAEVVYTNDDLDYGLANGIAPEVTAMKKAGVDFISSCIDLNGMKTLAQELRRQGMDDVVLYHPNTYSQSFVTEAGDLFEGDFVSVQFRPFEADASGTALDDFLTWMDETGAELSELAMVGWLNASLAFEGLLAAGPDFDRDKVTAATNRLTDFTAGGLIEPVDWTEGHTPYTEATRDVDTGQECTALVRIVDGTFETVAPPDEPWLCWEGTDRSWSEPVPTNFT
jgi:Periplasmic binding protein